MRRRRPASSSSYDDSNESDIASCFDTEDQVGGSDSDASPTDVDTDVEGGDEVDKLGIIQEDEDHPPEYYLNLEEDPESDDENENYKDSSRSLIDGMEERFHRSIPMSFPAYSSLPFLLLI
jgi:hypothetical protein